MKKKKKVNIHTRIVELELKNCRLRHKQPHDAFRKSVYKEKNG